MVVGGGPAGLSAALYAAREGIETLLIERSGDDKRALISALDVVPVSSHGQHLR